ncbi:hypothetical protein V8G54_024081 [Vigna mungo]|uniref:Reverse transcriptase/retrotransposon-derived protein RNase H-like domain-containing protein n=1 Tax=Vigna mungo TaxID=3915 RepID=A0AAQ3N5T3_VIGMU
MLIDLKKIKAMWKRFMQDCGKIAKPLTQLLRKNVFQWTKEAQQAFTILKEIPTQVWLNISKILLEVYREQRWEDTIFVVVDRFTKYANFLLYLILIQQWRWLNFLYGFPSSIILNKDKEIFKQDDTKLKYETTYHPQSDGQTEAMNHYLETYLRCMALYGCDPPLILKGTKIPSKVESLNQMHATRDAILKELEENLWKAQEKNKL